MVNRGVTLAGMTWAFTAFDQGNWHPLTWIAHMIDSQLFGMNAGGHLLVNALIHVANTLLVFWFLFRTTHARWPSALVAALFALRLSNALASYVKYVLLAFWPNDLAVYYPYTTAGIPAWQIICAAFLLIGITAFCFFQRKIRPYLVVGWLWFLGTLVPVIGIAQDRNSCRRPTDSFYSY